MSLSRRNFALGLGAGLFMLPLTRRKASAAASGPPKRLVFITSLGIQYSDWVPKSAAGSPVMLGPACQGLSTVVGDIMFVGGLPAPFSGENHGTSQHTTGLDFGHTNLKTSVETYIANTLKPATKLPSILLGASAKNGSSFYLNGMSQTTIDSPLDAYALAFGATSHMANVVAATTDPTTALVLKQIDALKSRVGATEAAKLTMYEQGLQANAPAGTTTMGGSTSMGGGSSSTTTMGGGSSNTTTMGGGSTTTGGGSTGGATGGSTSGGGTTGGSSGGSTGASGAACKSTPPSLGSNDPTSQNSTAPIGQLQLQLIPMLLGCDATRIVGMQWGITNGQVINVMGGNGDEHNNVHSLPGAESSMLAQDNYLCTAFASMITAMKATPDPLVPGSTLLDNTLVVWTRDIGNGPDHTQAQVPVVLAGATGYLKYNGAGGTYYDLSGKGTTLNMLLTMIDAMGAPIGNFASTSGGAQSEGPLTAIKM